MIRNYLKVAWRNLIKDRQFTFLNVIGLSTGLACTFLIYLWLADELQVNKYNENDARLYQVKSNEHTENGIRTVNYTPGVLAEALHAEVPEIEHAVTILPASWFQDKGVIGAGETHFSAGSTYVSKDYFQVFTLRYLDGDKNRLFSDKQTIAISSELAKKLFHTTENVVGKTIRWDHHEFSGTYTISGVFEEPPQNATDRFDLLFNFALYVEKRPGMLTWDNMDPNTYALLRPGADKNKVNAKIKDLYRTKNKQSHADLFLAKYSDDYLYGTYENGVVAGGRITYVKLFSLIAVFILLIACINFMNLSTAKATRRIKEVGIRKVAGARRGTLILQYLGESLLLTFLSTILAIGLVILLIPQFNTLTGKEIALHYSAQQLLVLMGIILVTGILAGSYPALYLSRFRPAAVLKGKLKNSLSELLVRKGLVVFQFTLSAIFIVSVLIVYRQVSYIQTKNLGYSRDNIIHFEIPFDIDSVKLKRAESFVQELRNVPGVMSASSYYHNLTGDHGSISDFHWAGKDPAKNIDFANLEVGDHFLETMGIQLQEGRYFSPGQNAQHEIVFNEEAIKEMGLKDPVGKTVKFWDQQREIVGVVKNFNFESLYQTVKPCFFQVYPVMPNVMVKIKGGTEKQTIERVQKVFDTYHKGLAFDYHFLDENYEALYASERRVGTLSRYFAGLAILISCLGLFGLAAFTAQRRQKEIGIRKIVGASVSGVVLMLTKDFLKLVAASILIGFPVAWWATHQWLSGFAYRIEMGAGVFILAAFAILAITLLTISFQSIRAAVSNPVKSLRSE